MKSGEESGRVWTDYDWKRLVLITHAMAHEAYQDYTRQRMNNMVAMRSFDIFQSHLVRLYGDIRPNLMSSLKRKETIQFMKEGELDTLIKVMDHARLINKRLRDDVAIGIFDRISLFLNHWGLTDIEMKTKGYPEGGGAQFEGSG